MDADKHKRRWEEYGDRQDACPTVFDSCSHLMERFKVFVSRDARETDYGDARQRISTGFLAANVSSSFHHTGFSTIQLCGKTYGNVFGATFCFAGYSEQKISKNGLKSGGFFEVLHEDLEIVVLRIMETGRMPVLRFLPRASWGLFSFGCFKSGVILTQNRRIL